MDYRLDAPQLLLDFLSYHETIKAHSQRTVDEYYLDMRNFFRYLKQNRDPTLADKRLDEIDVRDVDLPFIASITLTDIYGYLTYLSRERLQHQNSENSNKGLNAASRARKLATIRSFFNYICNKRHLLEENPCKDVDTPKQMKALPRYLTLQECLSLLESVDGPHRERDYCILTLFLNCGLRISELIGLDITDIQAIFSGSWETAPMISPVAGVVRYVNSETEDDGAVINDDPYGEGWIVKIELDDDEPDLLSAGEYAKFIAQQQ